MLSLASRNGIVLGLLLGAGALALSGGCGSDDDKKTSRGSGAGAGGAEEGGGPGKGGSEMAAAGEPAAGKAGEAGSGGSAGSPAGGDAGQPSGGASGGSGGSGGEGGAPVSACTVEGMVTGLSLNSEPIYQGCRGSFMRIDYLAQSSTPQFACCGTATPSMAFEVALPGAISDGSGTFEFLVPDTAPIGSYGLDIACGGTGGPSVVSIEVNDLASPSITNVPAQLNPGDNLVIEGQNLDVVDTVTAIRASDGSYFDCPINVEIQTATSITCSFLDIAPNDAGDHYVLQLGSEQCGVAVDQPQLVIVLNG